MLKRKNNRYLAISMIIIMLFTLIPKFSPTPFVNAEEHEGQSDIPENHIRVHFESGELEIANIRLWIYGDAATWSEELDSWPNGMAFPEGQATDYGPYVDIELIEDPELLEMIVLYEDTELLDSSLKIDIISENMDEVWISRDGDISLYEPVELEENHIRVHYYSEDGSYEPWGLWLWGDVLEMSEDRGGWPIGAQPFSNDQVGKHGAYTDVEYREDGTHIRFLFVNMETTEQFGDFTFEDLENHDQIFINGRNNHIYTNPYYIDEEEEEIEYKDGEYDITVSGEVSSSLNYNENAVLSVDIENNDDVGINEIFIDLTELGGSNKKQVVSFNNRISISVRYDIEPGEKTIPITVVDEDNGTYHTTTTVQVEPRPEKNGDFDWDEAIIYFMLTDRFYDGDPSNNDPYGIGYENYDNIRGTYQGGDFKGITKNLDYLEDLGINTIWITPIVENIGHDLGSVDTPEGSPGAFFGYHGYWAKNFEELNPHLGTLEDFHELIDSAAERNMKIMVDVVLNHPGYGLKMEDALPEDERPIGYPTDADRERFEGMIRERPGSNDLTMELSYLPDFITEDPSVSETLIDWQTSWIDRATTENGNTISYYRVDTVKHVDDATWQQFKTELTLLKPDFKLIGESWGAGQNNDHGYLNTGTMDSLLDFEFKGSARRFAQGQLESVNQDLIERNAIIDNTATLGQFLGSHDEDGFLSHLVDGNEGMLKIAAALQITAKGQPVIYYGEELGQSGANNWPQYDNRYDLDWDSVEDNHILEHYQKLLSFRNDHSLIFARGDRSQIAGSDEEEFLVFDRSFEGESVFVGLNVSEEVQEVTLEVESGATVTDSYSGVTYEADGTEVTVSIPAMADGGTVLLTVANEEQDLPEDPQDEDKDEEKDPNGEEPIQDEDEEQPREQEDTDSEEDKKSEDSDSEVVKDDSDSKLDEESGEKAGEKLPDTATNTYTVMLMGLVLLLLGGATLFVIRKKSVKEQSEL
ncbi:alpha-amylase family glycosyl hydrolase [Evansella cellulosilytica]|uniref:LPXTG-motif cell wall anchor domain protein n=1 Tax=Evansella cellulosilytica (strain ATCC 21833 / DSM 2522 / FERM P-1141 / JCM 9156 / N-4) TaxID=649639 RepID=E6TTZ6_EVAC2|nr:alpha-amylase family glycosyl hydrolase [Evansella cellulosilytica]ADU32027.1 LPXTG-motif cell wall anchor domain protein [Evansella cellulosilytica DSM 2522]